MEKPIRVLHYTMSSNIGGVETFIMNVYRNIDKNKVQFDFLTFAENMAFSAEIEKMGGKIFKVTSRRENFIKNHKEVINFFKNHEEYKIVHNHISSCSYVKPIIAAAKTGKRKIITHSHSKWSGKNLRIKIFHEINKLKVLKYSNSFFACSDVAGKYMFGDDIINSNKYKIIKNGIDTQQYIFNNLIRTKVRKNLNIENKFVVGNIGRLTYEKNHNFILEIFSHIYKSNRDALLLLVGGGELEKEIKLKIKKLGLEQAVLMLGVRRDIPELLQAMDVFIFPSLFEGLGIAVIEAQAAGLPCIVSDVIPEEAFVTDLIHPISLNTPVDEWARKILQYYDGYERKNMFEEIIANGYDIKGTAKWLEDFYCQLSI